MILLSFLVATDWNSTDSVNTIAFFGSRESRIHVRSAKCMRTVLFLVQGWNGRRSTWCQQKIPRSHSSNSSALVGSATPQMALGAKSKIYTVPVSVNIFRVTVTIAMLAMCPQLQESPHPNGPWQSGECLGLSGQGELRRVTVRYNFNVCTPYLDTA